jgi:hypothetical protein
MRSIPKVLAVAATLGLSFAMPVGATATEGVRELNFDVFLDDREIGFQRFTLTPTDDGTRIETQAKFAVKVLRITAFEYDHRNTEFWRNGCLQTIEARTDSNGRKQAVSGRDRGSTFVVATASGEQTLGDCVASFAYWDRRVLRERQQLLNSQTGEYTPVRIEPLGAGSVRVGGRDVKVERYAIRGKGIDISVAYAAGSSDWIALDSKLDGGRTLRYRRDPGDLGALAVAQTGRPGRDERTPRYTADSGS